MNESKYKLIPEMVPTAVGWRKSYDPQISEQIILINIIFGFS